MDADAKYCPFCGARLEGETKPSFEHFRTPEDCGDQFRAWDHGGDAASARLRPQSGVRRAVMWVIIAVVLLYSLLIVQRVLLGVVASAVVYLAFRWESIAVRLSR